MEREGCSPQRERSSIRTMRYEIRCGHLSAELIEEEAARIPDPNDWRAVSLREMARNERECGAPVFYRVRVD